MKSTFGVLAALLLIATMAVGQQSQLPFPQGANPALANEESAPAVVDQSNLPPSMAVSQNGTNLESSSIRQRHDFDNGSPFPQAANPSSNTNDVLSPFIGERSHDRESGSPFPQDANPSNR